MTESKYNLFTLAMIGVLGYMIADIVHEVIGHGGTCLIVGNKVSLITSAYFKSSPGNLLVDNGGPIANLIFGGLAFTLLNKTNLPKLLLLHVAAYNLFWFSGTVLHSLVSHTGDWTFAIMEISSGLAGKLILLAAGVSSYALFLRILQSQLAGDSQSRHANTITRQDILYPLLFATTARICCWAVF